MRTVLYFAIVALIATSSCSSSDSGSEDPPPEPVSFTFTDDCTRLPERPTSPAFSDEGPAATFYTCEIVETSDPRFAGTEIFSFSDSARDHGIVEITTENGAWVGTFSGEGIVNQSATGTGDYEGLLATWDGPGCSRNCDWSGTIEPIPEP